MGGGGGGLFSALSFFGFTVYICSLTLARASLEYMAPLSLVLRIQRLTSRIKQYTETSSLRTRPETSAKLYGHEYGFRSNAYNQRDIQDPSRPLYSLYPPPQKNTFLHEFSHTFPVARFHVILSGKISLFFLFSVLPKY